MTQILVAEGMADCGGTRWFDLKDRKTGAVRRVFLWVPSGETPEAGWPALWLLDGNAVIGTAVDAMRAQAFWPTGTNIGWGALIAIGYPSEEPYDSFRRSWDLGPPPGQTYPPFYPDGPEVKTGGGAEMARFLLEDVTDFLTDKLRLDATKQALFGHSFGGLFALWLMFTRPDAFSTWIAASPAITWEDSFLLGHLERFTAPENVRRVHLSAGEWEGDQLAPFQDFGPDAAERKVKAAQTRTVAAAQDLAQVLADRGINTGFEIYPDETHISVLPVAINRAIRWAFALDERALRFLPATPEVTK